MTNRECVCGVTITIGQQPASCKCIVKPTSGRVVHYVLHPNDVPQRDSQGNPVQDVNGNILYHHRKGDIMLDSQGMPLIMKPAPDFVRSKPVSRPGQVSTEARPVKGLIEESKWMSDEELDRTLYALREEQARRAVKGFDDPHLTVARI